MATKTISLELDAYEKLKRAKRTPRESFSMVIRRARWEETGYDGKEVLSYLNDLHATRPDCFLANSELDLIERRVRNRSIRKRTKWEE